VNAIPDTFRAYVVDRHGDRFERGLRTLGPPDLPEGDVEVRVAWSSVNYKDGLAATADGKVARAYPLVPGIDLAGTVVGSSDPAFAPGAEVIVHGYDLGVSRHGGYAEYARVPSQWTVPLPPGLSARPATPELLDGPFGRFERTERLEGGALVREDRLELRRGRIAPEAYGAFAAFAGGVDEVQGRPVVFPRSAGEVGR